MLKDKIIVISFGLLLGAILAFGIFIYQNYFSESSPQPALAPKTPIAENQITKTPETNPLEDFLSITAPEDDVQTSNPTIPVGGKTKANRKIIISGNTEDQIITALSDGTFLANIKLDEGANRITLFPIDNDNLVKRAGGLRGVPTGFRELDNRLAGLQDSNLIILAARPGVGKTAFVLNIAHSVAVKHKIPVGFFSLEMSKEELVDRLLVAQADIDSWKYKVGKLEDSDYDKLQDAYGTLADAPIYIDDTPGINLSEMRTKARRLQVESGLKLIIVDYLQLINPGKSYENRVVEVSMISQAMKNLARELRVPVIAVSQLSRAVESRDKKVPQLSDLRESGGIEQDADVVMFLYRVEDDTQKDESQFLTKLLIAKHRNGSTGEIDFMFVGNRLKFHSVEKKREKEE